MTISELIQQLQKLPGDAEIEVYYDVIVGGYDEPRSEEPLLFVEESLAIAYLTGRTWARRLSDCLPIAHLEGGEPQ